MEEVTGMLRPPVVPRRAPKPVVVAPAPRDEEPQTIESRGVEIQADESAESGNNEEEEETTYCYCDGPSFGTMVDCCDGRCDREWVRTH